MDMIWEPEVWWTALHVPGGQSLPSRMYWRASHPLEIAVIFGGTGTDPEERKNSEGESMGEVRWVFSRDLIREVRLKGKAGLGDVKASITSGNQLVLELTSPMGTARLSTPYQQIDRFVMKTFAEVSLATEVDCLPLSDGQLESLMETWGGHL